MALLPGGKAEGVLAGKRDAPFHLTEVLEMTFANGVAPRAVAAHDERYAIPGDGDAVVELFGILRRAYVGGVAPCTHEQAQRLMKNLHEGWMLSREGPYLRREFKFRDFYRTMSFVNALAHIANIEDHHPDLEVGYNYCRVQYTTHAIKRLCENDFICASKIDAIPLA